jgi:hypothetical protein
MTDVMKRCRKVIGAWLVALSVLVPLTSSRALAQKSKRQTTRASQGAKTNNKAQTKKPKDEKAQAAEDVSLLRDEYVRLTGEYKKQLEQLRTLQQKDVKKADDDLAKSRELYLLGLVAKKKIDEDERVLADFKAKVADTEQKMKASDAQIADALVEAKAVEAKAPPPARGKLIRTTAYIRYSGTGAWSLASGAGRVMGFFQQSFKKQLPISAFGQTAVHNQLGFDHRNAMDVALNPASREGQALIAYLQANGIPFFAFYMAIPGSATGPHIHVGMPSHRISPR